jgi:N-acetylglucosamine-6-phosphate deacetylase
MNGREGKKREKGDEATKEVIGGGLMGNDLKEKEKTGTIDSRHRRGGCTSQLPGSMPERRWEVTLPKRQWAHLKNGRK